MANLLRLQTSKVNTPTLGTITHEGKKIEVECETSSGRAWLAKYLHPPTEEIEGYCGFPDRNTLSTVQLHYRGEKELALSAHKLGSFVDADGPATKYLHLFHWGSASPCAGFWYDRQGNEPGFDPSVQDQILNKQFNAQNWDRDLSRVRHTYGSVSIYQDETAFSNRGVITVANFRPDFVDIPFTGLSAKEKMDKLVTALNCDPKELKLPKSWYKRKNAPTARDGYEIIHSEEPLTVDPPGRTRVFLMNSLPRDESDLLNLSRKAYSGMLRDGAFITSRLNQDVNLFKQASVFTGIVMYIRDQQEIIDIMNLDSGSKKIPSWIDEDFAFTFVMYSQMATSNEISNPFNANHILFKWYNGFEGDVSVGSGISTFTSACAMEDLMALRLANNVLHDAPDANVVATNSWATLAKLALQLAPKAVEWLGNVFGGSKSEEKEKKIVKKEAKKEVKKEMVKQGKPMKNKPQVAPPRGRSKSAPPKGSKPSVIFAKPQRNRSKSARRNGKKLYEAPLD